MKQSYYLSPTLILLHIPEWLHQDFLIKKMNQNEELLQLPNADRKMIY
jgi:hypothetical protein